MVAVPMVRLDSGLHIRRMVEGESIIVAYGNYGGNVFRNGVRMKIHEDAIPYRENEIWNFHKDLFHAVLGEKRFRLCGYKTYPVLFMDGVKLDVDTFAIKGEGEDGEEGNGEIEDYHFEWSYDGESKITLRLVEPDGTEWTGFSGYAMGAGWEDDDE